MAGVIVPARDRDGTSRWNFEARDLEVELVSEALEAGIQINILLSNILQQYIDIANINININIGFSSSSNINININIEKLMAIYCQYIDRAIYCQFRAIYCRNRAIYCSLYGR